MYKYICNIIHTQTCFLLAVNVIGQRMDLFAVGHALGLITILSRRSRKQIALIWKKYCYFLSGLLCFQYLLCIGFPPAACKGTHTHAHAHAHAHTRACICLHVHSFIPTYLHTYIHSFIYTYIHTYIHTCISSFLPTCIQLHAYTEQPNGAGVVCRVPLEVLRHGLQRGEVALPARLPDPPGPPLHPL